jgi:hypothetical protein
MANKLRLANLEALQIGIRAPSPTPAPTQNNVNNSPQALELIVKAESDLQASTPSRQSNGHISTPLLPWHNQTSGTSNGLTRAEMIMLIKHYRGHAQGLEDQSLTDLDLLLKLHKVSIKTAPVEATLTISRAYRCRACLPERNLQPRNRVAHVSSENVATSILRSGEGSVTSLKSLSSMTEGPLGNIEQPRQSPITELGPGPVVHSIGVFIHIGMFDRLKDTSHHPV